MAKKDHRCRLETELISLKEKSRLRTLKNIEKKEGDYIWINGEKYLNCSSNDYMGISCDHSLKKEFLRWCEQNTDSLGTALSSGSSRLLSGNSTVYDKTEQRMADLYGKEDSLIFSSGYHMNSGFFEAMCKKGDLIIADKLVHASIIDGIRLSYAKHLRYRHLDYDHLRTILKKERKKYGSVVIVSESIFSMDGDCAEIPTLSKIAKEFDAELFIDEAHAVNCIGEKGLGVCETSDTINDIDYIAGTFGKGYGGAGAFIVCNKTVKQHLINKCRSLIFTTALPPLNISWIDFVLSRSENMVKQRKKLAENSLILRNIIKNSCFKTTGNHHIVPLICGDDESALSLSREMAQNGIFVPSVRPPTVPEGKSRLRFSVTSTLNETDFYLIRETFREICS